MTRRTSVYLTDELSAAIAADGRSLADLIRAGLRLPSPLRLSRTELAAVTVVLRKLAQGAGEDQPPSGHGTGGSQSSNGPERRQGSRGKPKTERQNASASHGGCGTRVPAGSYCKQCGTFHR